MLAQIRPRGNSRRARRFSKFGAIGPVDTMDISDAVMGIFDSQQR